MSDVRDTDDWRLPRERAIPRLLDLYGGQLHGLARRLCGSADEADDLVQEVFMAAFRGWDGFDHRASPRTWLFTIAAHACQRMHRKRAGEPDRLGSLDALLPFDAVELGVVPDDAPTLDAAMRAEARDRIGEAIAGLPVDFRLPLVLKEIVGFPVAEVAAILGLPEATVKTRLHRARLAVRAALEGVLPRQALPKPAYDQQVCLDLLRAKQESLDRGVPMPGGDELICERCRSVFATMDLAADVCRDLGRKQLPDELRSLLLERMRAG